MQSIDKNILGPPQNVCCLVKTRVLIVDISQTKNIFM